MIIQLILSTIMMITTIGMIIIGLKLLKMARKDNSNEKV